MSGSGKSLLGLWLYRSGEKWSLKHTDSEVSNCFSSLFVSKKNQKKESL